MPKARRVAELDAWICPTTRLVFTLFGIPTSVKTLPRHTAVNELAAVDVAASAPLAAGAGGVAGPPARLLLGLHALAAVSPQLSRPPRLGRPQHARHLVVWLGEQIRCSMMCFCRLFIVWPQELGYVRLDMPSH